MPQPDQRNIATGRPIPTERYADQPYIVKTDDGAWIGENVSTTHPQVEACVQYILTLCGEHS